MIQFVSKNESFVRLEIDTESNSKFSCIFAETFWRTCVFRDDKFE
jgi:hypothetical protein